MQVQKQRSGMRAAPHLRLPDENLKMPPKSTMSRYSFKSDWARGEFGGGIVGRLAAFLPRRLACLGKREVLPHQPQVFRMR